MLQEQGSPEIRIIPEGKIYNEKDLKKGAEVQLRKLREVLNNISRLKISDEYSESPISGYLLYEEEFKISFNNKTALVQLRVPRAYMGNADILVTFHNLNTEYLKKQYSGSIQPRSGADFIARIPLPISNVSETVKDIENLLVS